MKNVFILIGCILGIIVLICYNEEREHREFQLQTERESRDTTLMKQRESEWRLQNWIDSTEIRDSIYKIDRAANKRLHETLEDIMLNRPPPMRVRIVE